MHRALAAWLQHGVHPPVTVAAEGATVIVIVILLVERRPIGDVISLRDVRLSNHAHAGVVSGDTLT